MAFNPESTIYLCAVPFDNSYKNQVYFTTAAKQLVYFRDRVKKTFSDYLTVRKTMPDGSLRSSVKVDANIDSLYGCNYMFYQNQNHGARYFYCFIVDLIYINEGTTEIVFETDVYQTWRFDVDVLESFVVREHSETDNPGDNVVPEPFNYTDYEFTPALVEMDNANAWLSQCGFLIASSVFASKNDTVKPSRGSFKANIYQGLYFYYATTATQVNDILDLIESEKEDSILFISVVPTFSIATGELKDVLTTEGGNNPECGFVTYAPLQEATTVIDFEAHANQINKFGNYENVRNGKMWTYPFYGLRVSNHSGESVDYHIEEFDNGVTFKLRGDVSANPSVMLTPQNYKKLVDNIDHSITIQNFPLCSFNSDSFKLWLAKNQGTLGLQTVGAIGSIMVGSALVASGAGSMIGGGMIAGGASKIANTINSVYQATREPNRAQTGTPKNNLLTGAGYNKFDYYFITVREEYAKTIDDYFTMFGYQTNEVKIPNVSARPYFNYVQTIDVNIADRVFGIPNKDMETLKQMYNNGVTLWKPETTIGDYSVDNSPS